eukprot:TRINITY_DN25348_c0_g1_i1.p1 TRINITY_DN25348_c0_g1~~TRINITY_DN25348_c0_g1_i1.p1  ORF type:complete len:416 (+),score=97.14 TRINITY_DN25348_c0_g1_i1:72-1250(+)
MRRLNSTASSDPCVELEGCVEKEIRRAMQSMAECGERGVEAMQYMRVYLQNAIQFPNVDRFSKINVTHPIFHEKVGRVPGALDLLQIAGFEPESDTGRLTMRAKEASALAKSIEVLCDALQELECEMARQATPNIVLTVSHLNIYADRTGASTNQLYYLRIRCTLLGSEEKEQTFRTEERVSFARGWKQSFELNSSAGAHCYFSLCERRRLLRDREIANGSISFGGGRSEPVAEKLKLTQWSHGRGVVMADVAVDMDSKYLRLWRAELQSKAAAKRKHTEFKQTLAAEGRMPEAPDLAEAGVAEEGYVRPDEAHRSQFDPGAALPAAYAPRVHVDPIATVAADGDDDADCTDPPAQQPQKGSSMPREKGCSHSCDAPLKGSTLSAGEGEGGG